MVSYSVTRHRCFDNFIVNLLGAIAAYCLFPKSRASMYKGPLTHSLHCSEFVELTLILNRFYSDGIICQHGKVSLQFKEVIFSRNQLIHQESQLCIILIINRLPTGFQKGVFCTSKGHLLHIKRCPFTLQKGVFYNAKEHVLLCLMLFIFTIHGIL